MKCLFLFTMLMAFIFTHQAYAEYFTEVYAAGTTNIIQVPTNKVMSKMVIYDCSVSVDKNGVKTFLPFGMKMDTTLNNGSNNAKFAGPAIVTFVPSYSTPGFVSYELSDNDSVSISKPSNAVVIPADSIGPIEIVLESSKDLITWTAAEPGIYGATDQKRFFRVRAVAR